MLVMMPVVMVMMQLHSHVGCGYAALGDLPQRQFELVPDAELTKPGPERLKVGARINERPQRHISAYPRKAVEIGYSHRLLLALSLFRDYLLSGALITCARYPAPKPLSMLTTLTPAAQELSIESSAARPPKLAP